MLGSRRCCLAQAREVSKSSLVRFDWNRYSVAVKAARRTAQLRVYADRVVVWCGGEIVGEHSRRFGRGSAAQIRLNVRFHSKRTFLLDQTPAARRAPAPQRGRKRRLFAHLAGGGVPCARRSPLFA
jgi:hypothetical protein